MIARYLFLIFCFIQVLPNSSAAQVSEKEAVIKEVKTQLDALTSPTGEIGVYCQKNNIKGEFVMDITLEGKGKILTIFMVSTTAEDIRHQNMLKIKIFESKFDNIKIPKKERIKFRHTITI
jgi:hypothetical protein